MIKIINNYLAFILIITTILSCSTTRSSELSDAGIFTFITPQTFGAKGDGKADDSQSIQKAINFCIKNKRKLFLPSGNYRFTTSLNINGQIIIEGESKIGSYLWYDPTNSNSAIIIGNNKICRNIELKNFKIGLRNFGKNKSNVHALLVKDTNIGNFVVEKVVFFGFSGCGLYLTGKNTYGQNLAFRDLSFYRMGGMIGQNNDRGISNWWVNIVVFDNIHLDAYSGHSINLQSPQKYIFDMRGWRMVQITNLLIEGAIQAPVDIQASVRIGGGYTPKGSNYLGLGNVTIHGYWEEWSTKVKPRYSINAIEGISSINIIDYNGGKFDIDANALTLNINGIRIHGLNTKDRFDVSGKAKIILDNVLNSMDGKVKTSHRSNPNIEVRSFSDKY